MHSVAQAIARNPFVIIVSCHRVLEAGGYADDVLLPVAPPRPQT
jgi:methylated-DNA-[protein]-cysteine S-methyltransferase